MQVTNIYLQNNTLSSIYFYIYFYKHQEKLYSFLTLKMTRFSWFIQNFKNLNKFIQSVLEKYILERNIVTFLYFKVTNLQTIQNTCIALNNDLYKLYNDKRINNTFLFCKTKHSTNHVLTDLCCTIMLTKRTS